MELDGNVFYCSQWLSSLAYFVSDYTPETLKCKLKYVAAWDLYRHTLSREFDDIFFYLVLKLKHYGTIFDYIR